MKLPISQRLQEIALVLQETGYVNAKDLAKKYNVSMETIRKDLTYLQEMGVAKKEYGGASVLTDGIEKDTSFRNDHEEKKKQIAQFVSLLLKDYHSVILDSGSTCKACVSYINLLPTMDIVTNSISAFENLNGKHHNVFLTGGKKREKNQSVIGSWTVECLKKIQVDVCLLGTAGLLDSSGPTAHSYAELETKRAMIAQSSLVFVLADSSKFQEKGLHTVASWDEIDGIITDNHLSLSLAQKYNKFVPIYLAQEELDEKNSEDFAIL